RLAGGGCVLISEGVALLSGTSVLPEFRSRGIQSALIRARLVYSAAHGCDIATVGTTPGSSSERNVQRHGFRVAYTRVKLSKAW
ncbi:MAG: GNAT family N-acetyltransferase, partial [Acidobacteriota bacterium]|nr:GNAT family N-acetyltransferase [Acidobacteriota bacterium]